MFCGCMEIHAKSEVIPISLAIPGSNLVGDANKTNELTEKSDKPPEPTISKLFQSRSYMAAAGENILACHPLRLFYCGLSVPWLLPISPRRSSSISLEDSKSSRRGGQKRTNHPSNRPMRLILLLFLIVLVTKDIQERNEEAKPAPLVVQIAGPTAPKLDDYAKR